MWLFVISTTPYTTDRVVNSDSVSLLTDNEKSTFVVRCILLPNYQVYTSHDFFKIIHYGVTDPEKFKKSLEGKNYQFDKFVIHDFRGTFKLDTKFYFVSKFIEETFDGVTHNPPLFSPQNFEVILDTDYSFSLVLLFGITCLTVKSSERREPCIVSNPRNDAGVTLITFANLTILDDTVGKIISMKSVFKKVVYVFNITRENCASFDVFNERIIPTVAKLIHANAQISLRLSSPMTMIGCLDWLYPNALSYLSTKTTPTFWIEKSANLYDECCMAKLPSNSDYKNLYDLLHKYAKNSDQSLFAKITELIQVICEKNRQSDHAMQVIK